jgi:hypothetical protein
MPLVGRERKLGAGRFSRKCLSPSRRGIHPTDEYEGTHDGDISGLQTQEIEPLDCHSDSDQKHLFVGSENRTALIMQFQLFAVASSDGFLGNVERR